MRVGSATFKAISMENSFFFGMAGETGKRCYTRLELKRN